MNLKCFIIAEFFSVALPQCGDDLPVRKITVDHTSINSGLNSTALSLVIYIIFIWKCAGHFWRYFYELFLGIGEAHHG
jgi:hypothetical protein